ncbi:hypothetical protein FO519_006306 [Halicephalobus sp. NKZ332]|nr:hypothetical protein FO519_006306 [Halicephalobus sp. NKZ332]
MTIGSHVAEIARQGIWASLTGGWCYEPANSIFCNTVHLYTWSILLITPLLIGIFASGAVSVQVFIGYVIFIVLFFALLKLAITYLHNVFDTTDPIIKYTANKKSTQADVCRSPRSSFSGRAMSMNDIEMVDMAESRRRRRSEAEGDDVIQRHSMRFEEDEPEFANVLFNNMKSIREDDSSSSGSSKKSHNGLLEDKEERPKIVEAFILPTDSFELLPIANNRRPSEGYSKQTFTRKLSEPSFEALATSSRTPRRKGSTSSTTMRRVHSSSDAAHHFQRRYSAFYTRDSRRGRRSSPPMNSQSRPEIFLEKSKFEETGKSDKIVDDGQEPCCSKSIKPAPSVEPGPSKEIPDPEKEEKSSVKSLAKLYETKLPSSGMLRRLGHKDFPAEEIPGGQPEDLKGKITKFLEELIDKHPETLDVIESVRQNRLGNRATFSFDVERDRDRPPLNVRRRSRHRAVASSGFAVANLREGTHVAYDHEDTSEGAVHSFQDENGTWWTYTFSDQGTGVAHPLGSTRAINEMFNQRKSESPGTGRKVKSSKHRRHASAAGAVMPVETCSIDSSQSGPSRLARSAGPSSRRSGSLTTDKIPELSSGTYDLKPDDEIGKISDQHDSTTSGNAQGFNSINEDEEKRPKRRRRRRQRVHSSSSEEGGNNEYISNIPSSIFHAPGHTAGSHSNEGIPFSRQFISLAQLASRFTGGNQFPILQQTTGASISRHSATATPAGTHGSGLSSSRARTALEVFADERRRRVLNVGESPGERREYIRLQMDSDNGAEPSAQASSLASMRVINELAPLGATGLRFTPRQSRVKANYYYRLKPFTIGQGLQVKLDRLSVAALFDRNNSIVSYFVDIILAALVTTLAAALIGRGIYEEISLLFFAFVVAGSQFSLLKSVQPDAASPVHGFNWLVAYSRPVYFILLATIILILDLWSTNWNIYESSKFLGAWNLNPFTEEKSTSIEIIIGLRDVISIMLLLLPIGFTIGILRSMFAVGLLTLIGHFAYYFDAHSTQNTVFSGFVALTISIGYVMSRWSSNPLFVSILFNNLMPWNRGCISMGRDQEEEDKKIENKNQGVGGSKQETTTIAGQNEIEIEAPTTQNTNQTNISIMGGFKTTDPLPEILKNTLGQRVNSDLFYFTINSIVIFGLHSTSLFTAAQPYCEISISMLCIFFGFVNHYLYRKLRMHTPWKIFSRPILKAHEFFLFESTVEAKLMFFERIHIWMRTIEKNILYPLLMISYMTSYSWELPVPVTSLSDPAYSWIVVPISALCGFRIIRTAYSQPQMVYIPLTGVFVLCSFGIGIFQKPDLRPPLPDGVEPGFWTSPKIYITPLVVLYLFIMIYPKVQELTLKLNFVLAYIAPWQISWGSAFHAFAQPFSLPHSGMILLQAIFSSLISAPLNPFLGSSFFLMSYVRPVKFWEKDYNTKRVDHSNLRLISQIDRGPMMDDSNLNAIFYEHLTRSLQQSLAGDLCLGRWATSVHQGDCFILASNYLNCLVHIVEVGNGFVTFQVRGLEFRGTYCHQREVEAISEDMNDSNGFCCCTLASPPGMLSINNMFALRWLAWEVTASKYIIDGYSITDNSAVNLLQVHELRRLLVSLYIKCIVYYALASRNFDKWLGNETILKALEPIISNHRYVDNDQMFCAANDEDYDLNVMGISRNNFEELYGTWIQHCYERKIAKSNGEMFVNEPHDMEVVNCFCFALSILGRRTLGAAAYNRHANAAESFLFGLHALFKGDLRITSSLDEWVFCDPDILSNVVSPAVRMALKLHQDHFAAADDFEQISQLYEKIEHYQTMLFISHEHDPAWRQAIISNTPSLLALRHMYDDGQDDYKIIMLNKMHLNMRVIKLNRECVRAFWAGQQQELIFLRNRNPERGSIQNARQVLRNMINSSADQPIGYPIYVSPLTTSFIESHDQIKKVLGSSITFCKIGDSICKAFRRLRQHFGPSGSSNLPVISQGTGPLIVGPAVAQAGNTPAPYRKRGTTGSAGASSGVGLAGSIGGEKLDDAISIKTAASSIAPPGIETKSQKSKKKFEQMEEEMENPTKEIDDGLEEKKKETSVLVLGQTAPETTTTGEEIFVQIADDSKVLSKLNEPLKATSNTVVVWPSEEWRKRGGKSLWPNNVENGMRGTVAHIWKPFHANIIFRSHAGYIYLVRMFPKNNPEGEPFFVPILRDGVMEITKEEFLQSTPQSSDPVARLGIVRHASEVDLTSSTPRES